MDETPIFTGIRINTSKVGAKDAVIKEFGELQNVPWCNNGFYADKSKISGNHPYHLAGLFYFQEPSAMSTVSALNIESDDYVLDLCAAPGGKATELGVKLCGRGVLVANDISNKSDNSECQRASQNSVVVHITGCIRSNQNHSTNDDQYHS